MSSATASPPREKTTHAHEHDVGGTETAQSLIVAFVLAMIFRGFVVEGFVIPTGSMAPSPLARHHTSLEEHFLSRYGRAAPPGAEDAPRAEDTPRSAEARS